MSEKTSLLSVDDLCVDFRAGERVTHAVKNVSFEIDHGETLALVGESGSGKTVSALSILQLLPYPAASHPSGAICFKGENLLALPREGLRHVRGNQISMIFQEPMTSLNPLHTIERQIAEVLRIHKGLTGDQARARVIDLLTKVGIQNVEERLGSYPHQMSGGLCQRVVFAIAICAQPDLIIADEPTTALDVTVQKAVLDTLKRMAQQDGIAVILITHDMGVVAE
ncbi:MAG: ABC transporter ATP-binding protein, partial [Pseudomonadota bacterium]